MKMIDIKNLEILLLKILHRMKTLELITAYLLAFLFDAERALFLSM
jgi:hypothetical protein